MAMSVSLRLVSTSILLSSSASMRSDISDNPVSLAATPAVRVVRSVSSWVSTSLVP